MQDASIPQKFPIPWGNSAGGAYIRPIPTVSQIGIQDGAASLTDGFPPLTQTSEALGGAPPFGQDMNGILKQLTQWSQWQQAGAPIGYDGTFSGAIGGYPKGAVLSAATFGTFWLSTADNNATNPDAGGAGWIDLYATITGGFANRAALAAARIGATTPAVFIDGWTTPGDTGVRSMYVRGFSAGPAAIESADGQWWNLAFTGTIDLRELGAGLGSGAADVAAMAAALALSITIQSTLTIGALIYIPPGNYDFSAGQFSFTHSGTRIIGAGVQNTSILFNPASAAVLLTFWMSGVGQGISNCELAHLTVLSTNLINKTVFNLKNTSRFDLHHVRTVGITDSAGTSVALLYQGREWLDFHDCEFNSDNPVVKGFNPDRALVNNEDSDFFTARNNQLTGYQTSSSAYSIPTGLNVSNFSDDSSDYAKCRFGVSNIDGSATINSINWSFKNCRHEQTVGTNPTMFNIQRSGAGVVQQFSAEKCTAGAQLFNFTGIAGVLFESCIGCDSGPAIMGSTDATVEGLSWKHMVVSSGSTLALAGQVLVHGRTLVTGAASAPIYEDATYSNTPNGTLEWSGAPSANGRQIGVWRFAVDVPIFTGANQYVMLPWTIETIAYAQIKISANGGQCSGVVEFISGQASPSGCTIISGQANFAVSGNASLLSVFHGSDTSVQLINKLSAPVSVSIEVLFTI